MGIPIKDAEQRLVPNIFSLIKTENTKKDISNACFSKYL
jgi:hypothetical protein